MARCRYAAAVELLWRRHGDDLRLCAHGQAVAARDGRDQRASDLRDHGRQHGRRMSSVDRTDATPEGLVRRASSTSSISMSGSATKPARETRLDLPTDIWMEAHRDWLAREAAQRLDGRRTDLCRGHGARHLAVGLPGGRPQFQRSCSSRAAPGAAGLVLERPASSCCRSSTNSGPCSRSARHRPMAGAASHCSGLPEHRRRRRLASRPR